VVPSQSHAPKLPGWVAIKSLQKLASMEPADQAARFAQTTEAENRRVARKADIMERAWNGDSEASQPEWVVQKNHETKA